MKLRPTDCILCRTCDLAIGKEAEGIKISRKCLVRKGGVRKAESETLEDTVAGGTSRLGWITSGGQCLFEIPDQGEQQVYIVLSSCRTL